MVHGGAAPQVKKAAALRLAALVDPAIGVLEKSLRQFGKDRSGAQRIALSILDRTGHGVTSTHELKGGLNLAPTDLSQLRDAILGALKEHPEARIAVARRLLEMGEALDKANESVQ